jgi:hypothetical protein
MISRFAYAILAARAFRQLHRYDFWNSVRGFKKIHQQVAGQKASSRPAVPGLEAAICDAVSLAGCFYWRPVLCLQRSYAATVLLRQYGIPGRLVIGYRPAPFFSHAWVEVDGRVVNDSQGYKERLQVLCTA